MTTDSEIATEAAAAAKGALCKAAEKELGMRQDCYVMYMIEFKVRIGIHGLRVIFTRRPPRFPVPRSPELDFTQSARFRVLLPYPPPTTTTISSFFPPR